MQTDPELKVPTVVYPTSDGEPMAESDVHRDQMIQLITSLEAHFISRQDVYVTGNILVFYQEGDGRRHISPDVMVVFEVEKRQRDHYKLWEEGKAPDVVIEVTSGSTRNEDMGSKKGLYALHGVREYFVFDPLREYLPAGLRGFQLMGEEYLPMVGTSLMSQVLNLELRIVNSILRLFDPARDELLPIPSELADKVQRETARAEAEAARAEAEAARATRLEKELEALRIELKRRPDEKPSA